MSGVSTILGTGNDLWPGAGLIDNSLNDSVAGNLGNDTIDGGNGNDTIVGGVDGVNRLIGGNNSDSIIGGNGFVDDGSREFIDGGDGNDTILVGNGFNPDIRGGIGDDSIIGSVGGGPNDLYGQAEELLGQEGNDTIVGRGAFNSDLFGGEGDDSLLGGSDPGVNNLYGDGGDDTLVGGTSRWSVFRGGDGNDIITTGSGATQEAFGGSGNDNLIGGVSNDSLDGGTGDDTLRGNGGEDSLFGDTGNDFADYTGADTFVSVDLSAGTGDVGNDALAPRDLLSGIEGVIGSDFNDTLGGDTNANTLIGGDGSDSLLTGGGKGGDLLDYGAGNDTFLWDSALTPGNLTLIGGAGNDFLNLARNDWVSGIPTGNDWINFQNTIDGVTVTMFTQGWERVVCFAEGTRIVTPGGEDVVENLRAGHMVLAMRNGQAGFEPLRWVGFMDIAVPRDAVMAAKTAPILIKAGAIAPGMPARDLRVSPDHAMEIDGHLIPAKHLVNGSSIIQEIWCKRVRYFHLELEAHGLLLSEGTWSESYLDDGNRHAFNNAALTGLFLDFEAGRSKGEYDHMACLPVLRQGLKLDEIHGRLALRAEELARAG
ncbi:MAG: Hint domain-containing protein, partial [Roseomonas sp.]|nr:Hint domain-containing protein [Roseomonas sp.]